MTNRTVLQHNVRVRGCLALPIGSRRTVSALRQTEDMHTVVQVPQTLLD